VRFRTLPAIGAVLLTAACASISRPGPTVSQPATDGATQSPVTTTTTASAAPTQTATTGTKAGGRVVVIPASKLPYPAAQGAPTLGDVSILKTAGDPCAIPADDSGNEGQLINAELVGNVVVVTFEFTNPCAKPLSYAFKVIQAEGSATGPTGGDPVETTTPPIAPGKSITFKVNVDPKPGTTAAQLQQLWVGITHISKQPGY
jgi:hypothetical protein